MLHQPVFSGRLFHFVALLTAVALMFGCKTERDPTDPEDAYYTFRDALIEGDADAVWERADEQTHAYYEKRYEQLVEMDENIEEYLPQTDHELAREQAGTELLDEVDDGRELFVETFEPGQMPEEEAVEVGSDVDELKLAEDESSAKVITRAGQDYLLTRDEESGEWHVMLTESTDAIDASFAWLDKNRESLRKTVEDQMADKKERREAIIADLMGKDD